MDLSSFSSNLHHQSCRKAEKVGVVVYAGLILKQNNAKGHLIAGSLPHCYLLPQYFVLLTLKDLQLVTGKGEDIQRPCSAVLGKACNQDFGMEGGSP